MRTNLAGKNLIAISANNREAGINVFQALDTTVLTNISDVINLNNRREDNADQATGFEEATLIYDNGSIVDGFTMNFDMAQPQHFALLLGYGLGSVATSAAGTGQSHLITGIDGDVDIFRSNPTFSAGMKYGTILKRRFATFGVDTVNAKFAKDDWVKVSGGIKGTGKFENNYIKETISANDDATTLTLAANGVHGASASERLDNIHKIVVELVAGVWTEVAFSAVSADTPAEITITAPGSATTSVSYKVLYVPVEESWCTFPARVDESPMRVAQMTCNVGGVWDGSDFVGGRDISAQINSLEYNLQNGLKPEFAPGAGGAYASKMLREGRQQTLKLDKEFRDVILQDYIDANEYFGVKVLCEGAEFASGHKFGVQMVFPQVGVIGSPITVNGKRLAEAGDFKILEHATYGSTMVWVKNLVSSYAA